MHTNISLEVCYNSGIRHYENGQYDLAIECFSDAIKGDPLNHKYHYNLGLAYVKKDEYDLAISSFEKALSLNFEDIDIFHNLGIAYSKKGEYEKAVQTYQSAIEIGANDYNSYAGLGIAYFSLKNYDEAIINFKKALELNPENSSLAYNLAYAYYITEKYDLAQDYFLYVISINNQDVEAHFNLGNIYLKQGKKGIAVESFKKVLSLNPDHKEAANILNELEKPEENITGSETENLFNKGLYYFSNSNYLQAINCFKSALLIKPDDSNIKEMLNKASEERRTLVERQRQIYQKYIDTEQYDTAIEVLKKAIAENPLESENYFTLGKVYIKKKEYYNAIECLREVLSLDPDNIEAKKALVEVIQMINIYRDEAKDYFKLAVIYTEKQDYVSALNALRRVLQLKADDSDAKALLAKVITLINETSTNYNKKIIDHDIVHKIVEYKDNLKKNPDDYKSYIKLGIIYGQLQKYDVAINCFKKVLVINPECEEAKQSLFALMKIINGN